MSFWRPEPKNNRQEIKLAFPNVDDPKIVHIEYIPPRLSRVSTWFHYQRVGLIQSMRWPLYYIHVRCYLAPLERKIYDLQFLIHVDTVHDGEPDDWRERMHYNKLMRRYGNEMAYYKIFHADAKDYPYESDHVVYQPNHYLQAYKERYIDHVDQSAQWSTLYHGVTPGEDGMPIWADLRKKAKASEKEAKRLYELFKEQDAKREEDAGA